MSANRVVAASNRAEGRRSFVYPALMSLGVGVLASCAEKPPPVPPQTVAVEPPPSLPPTPLHRRVFPLPPHKPSPPIEADATGAGGEALALASPSAPAPPAAPPPAAPPPAAPPPRTSALIGLDQGAATHLLGAATEKAEAPPATIWRYRNATCELDLFFYLDLRSGKMRTLHYAFKGQADDPAGREDCLRSFVIARGG
jgi:hypothetical protein